MGEAAREFAAAISEINSRIGELAQRRGRLALMEVCGTHTMAISETGIRRALDSRLRLLSGPGCPVCVTDQSDIDMIVSFAARREATIVTFGDMMRVPGRRGGSLEQVRSTGADVRVVYSPIDALALAARESGRSFVFVGVGFETTAPTLAAAIVEAARRGLRNFFVLSLLKTIPAALRALVMQPARAADGLILPGHVSAVIGTSPYEFLVREFSVPCCVAGFETADILAAINELLSQLENGARLAVKYRRVVRPEGNPRSLALLSEVFVPVEARWRGLGRLADSGLELAPKYQFCNARRQFGLIADPKPAAACHCGQVMLGQIVPTDCDFFAKRCTPDRPLGPCMVSSEGACAAYYKYERGSGDRPV